MWKKNILEDLETELLEYKIIGEFLAEVKKKFRRGDKEIVKVVELKKLEQEEKTMKEFIQKFRKAVRESRYEE